MARAGRAAHPLRSRSPAHTTAGTPAAAPVKAGVPAAHQRGFTPPSFSATIAGTGRRPGSWTDLCPMRRELRWAVAILGTVSTSAAGLLTACGGSSSASIDTSSTADAAAESATPEADKPYTLDDV